MARTKIDAGTQVQASTVTNTEVATNAGIEFSKLEALTDGNILIGNVGNAAAQVTPSGDITLSNAGVFGIASEAIVNGDISTTAGIAFSKMETLTSGQFVVANGSGVPTAVSPSGDITFSTAGVFAIGSGVIVEGDLNSTLETTLIRVDGSQAFTANQSMGNNKLTNVGTPTTDLDAANKLYVDNLAAGLDPKESVRAATTAVLPNTMTADNVAPTTGNRSYDTTAKTITWFAGQGPTAIDGVTLVNDDRILVKDESATSGPSSGEGRIYNGIYVRTSQDVWTRATDQDGTPANEVSGGNFTFVEQGTSGGGTGWVVLGDGILTLQTDNIIWVQFSEAGQITAGAGVSFTGTTLNVGDIGRGIQVNADDLEIDGSEIAASGLKEDATNSWQLELGPLTKDWDQSGAFDIILNNADAQLQIYNGANYATLDAGTLTGGNSTFQLNADSAGTHEVWNSGNDGSGSGLDADTLDGSEATAFLLSGATDNYTSGTLTFDSGTTVTMTSASLNLPTGATSIAGAGSGSGLDADLLDGVQGSGYLLSTTDNFTTGTLTFDSGTTVTMTAASLNLPTGATTIAGAGAGSGLDADLLDGQHGSAYLRSDVTASWGDAVGAGTLTLGDVTNGADTIDFGANIVDMSDPSGTWYINEAVDLTATSTQLNAAAAEGVSVTREVPTGTKNGTNVYFTLANAPIAGSEHLYLNGVLQSDDGETTGSTAANCAFVNGDVNVACTDTTGVTAGAILTSSTGDALGVVASVDPGVKFVLQAAWTGVNDSGSLGVTIIVADDYAIRGSDIAFSLAPQSDDKVHSSYRY